MIVFKNFFKINYTWDTLGLLFYFILYFKNGKTGFEWLIWKNIEKRTQTSSSLVWKYF